MKFTPEVVAALEVLHAAAENDFERHRLDVLERDLHEPPQVEILDDKHQRFNGVTHRKNKDKHFTGGIKLHRAVYEYFVGDIPDGYHVHHIDCNPANNNPNNLQCLAQAEHAKLHAEIAGTVPPLHKTIVRQCVNCGKEFTVAERANNSDCCSPSCRMAQRFRNLREPRICQRCGKEFVVYKYSTAQFCSDDCRFADVQTVKRNCPVCGKEFETYTWNEKNCCSHRCASQLMWNTKRANDRTKAKTCEFCGKEFLSPHKTQRFCSKSCAMKHRNNKS